ncbi:ribonuclease D [Modestobacter sp. VKM Ac-2979]|uniref:ribonuclease D n=1 Tax=unclassified Modestobacter TaxID=2643866 RepID=UPI0022AB768A|nr:MULTISPECIES: ribonuclease D [unclassified Modestobacter]MCZ2813642.1 ribonuclease D [Modestobacter sp. VKM Ac-2979]MCZ2842166.1 ribonuclease D [Modestobacter sp. VKM Ac-2980]
MSVSTNPRLTVLDRDLSHVVAQRLRGEAVVACDLETSGLDWRVNVIGTVQLYAPSVGAVIIRVGDSRPALLVDLLEDASVLKVFHHAPFDLSFLVHRWSMNPASIRCTKIASKLLRPDAPPGEHSLASLLRSHLDVTLAKGAVRTSEWTATSLTDEQLQYAANDVRYLLSLFDILDYSLRRDSRGQLYDRCCDFLPAQAVLETGGYPDVFAY